MTSLDYLFIGALILGGATAIAAVVTSKDARDWCIGLGALVLSGAVMIGACWLLGWVGVQVWVKATGLLA